MRSPRVGSGPAVFALSAMLCAVLAAREKASRHPGDAGPPRTAAAFEVPQTDGADAEPALEETDAPPGALIDPPIPPTADVVALAPASPNRHEPSRRSGSRSPPAA
jgi:hypothetical protein